MIGRHYKLRAFSLIEILITIAIISILVSIAAPSYARYTRRAHYTEITSAALLVAEVLGGNELVLQCAAEREGMDALTDPLLLGL